MHVSRILAIIGVLIGIVGLFMKSLTTDGEGLLVDLAQANPAFPDGIPTIWGGLDTWAQVVVGIAIVVVVALVLRPPTAAPFARMGAIVVSVIGLGLTIYAIVKFMEAGDSADTLQAGFADAAALGGIPEAYTVSTGIGFFVLMAGTVLVLIGGLLAMRGMGSDRDGTAV